MEWIAPSGLSDGLKLNPDMAVAVESGLVTDIAPLSGLDRGSHITKVEGIIGPGLFDCQVNGGGGVQLNGDPSPAGVRTIAAAHRNAGTTYLLPTVITDRFEVMEKAALAVLEEVDNNGVVGVHMEGPHISVERKGAHNPDFIRPFDERTMGLLQTLRGHHLPVLLTLAPECVEPGVIARLNAMGVVVSAGHTAATGEQIDAALKEGLRCFTHLFNAMRQMTSREPGVVGAAINSDVWCGIIADGHHVDDGMCALAIRARPVRERMIVVSDAMATVGGPDHFELYGETIRVDHGRLINANGSLAGAHIDLKHAVERLIENVGVPAAEAIAMATSAPAQLMKVPTLGMVGQKLSELSIILRGASGI